MSDITRVLFISNSVFTYERNDKYVLPGVVTLEYDFDETTGYMSLLKQLARAVKKHDIVTIDSVGFMYHSDEDNTLQMYANADKLSTASDTDVTTYTDFTDFIHTLRYLYNVKDIDLISCSIINDTKSNVFKELDIKKIHVNASINDTGYGGDWVLEYGKVKLIGRYFNKKIKRSDITLKSPPKKDSGTDAQWKPPGPTKPVKPVKPVKPAKPAKPAKSSKK